MYHIVVSMKSESTVSNNHKSILMAEDKVEWNDLHKDMTFESRCIRALQERKSCTSTPASQNIHVEAPPQERLEKPYECHDIVIERRMLYKQRSEKLAVVGQAVHWSAQTSSNLPAGSSPSDS